MIELKNVSKLYDGSNEVALEKMSLEVGQGEFLFLVGPSGAGKSTLIKLLFREQLPTEGVINFENKDITKYRKRDILEYRRRIGMIFQDYKLIKQKTVFENVAFALEVLGHSPMSIQKKVTEALDKVGLSHKATSFPRELSGGEQQRVGVARAIVKDPVLILADEPTGNLDRDNALQLMQLLEKINDEGTTMIIATHAWDLVDRMQKRVISLAGGKLKRDEKGGYSDE
ncbi:cell division ATP-binding protein FtsE [Serpentinicella sp. ANB-PHB4]|uniref:cell division ATP-binding protein FtsE n=1 Tax=Serpentinicella sp. ANB-PHB4 TaxID=3074076 RepID=UPI0028669FCE|nr:cell division ATP-binding protein FtsE [Serpentinicella sp. ANB-PHB4]MDR5658850.1 cell division ATP-binding protein FtsE [Serpentinicella sp. ANB-PHB4]